MPQIDAFLSHLGDGGSTRAVLRPNASPQFMPSGVFPYGEALSNPRIEEILAEIAPPTALEALAQSGATIFDYPTPKGVLRVSATRATDGTTLEIAPVASAPSVASPLPVTPQNSIPNSQNNDSGQKTAVLPLELRGFNWGGLLLSWVWAIGHNTWIGLLGLIPGIGLIMRVVLGAKGNEMAWRNRKWESVAQFRATQRTWALAGVLVLFLSFFFYMLLAAILFPVFARARENARRSSCQTHLRHTAIAAIQFTADNKGKFPSGTTMAAWKTALGPYVGNDSIYNCPSTQNGEESYILNPNLASADLETIENPAQTPLLFDADARHLEGVNVAFADGHIKWYNFETFESEILPHMTQ
ncbi:MAG TPA: DUF1559 domain-containing protein [Abditibacterium sp.]